MITLFPDLTSRAHLKKKIHLCELLPDYEAVLPRLLEHKETH